MKVLISAMACNPYLGSENYFGWAAVKCLAQDHELCVITGSRNQGDLARAQAEGLVPPGVRFVYAGPHQPWHPKHQLARLQNWKEYLYFLRDSLGVARDLQRTEKFEVVHHVTFTAWRVASPLWQLGLPFILGPICGDEDFPFRLLPLLSLTGAAFELLRKTSNFTSLYSPRVRRCIRAAAHVFAITPEAERLTAAIRGSPAGISHLSPGFYSAAAAAEFSRFVPGKKADGVLRLYAAGNLGGQKCIALAFQALARVKKSGVNFRYHLGASGPEIPHLKKLAARLGLTSEVHFGGTMSREAYRQELGGTHVYLLPSMRETVGLTMLEAMLAGCVPVVADTGGPAASVTDACGYKIAVSSPCRMAEEIAGVLLGIDRDRSIVLHKGAAASNRIATHFAEENYRRTVNAAYQSVTRRGRGPSQAQPAI
jgi:glycosyltransferase involved in cell wall biosynthesis